VPAITRIGPATLSVGAVADPAVIEDHD